MSGTFMDLHVPPTLVAFAVNVSKVQHVLSPEFKQAGSAVVLVPLKRDEAEMPDFAGMKKNYSEITRLIREGAVLSAQTVRTGGIAAAVSKMTFGNRLGMVFLGDRNSRKLFSPEYGSIILEVKADCQLDDRLAEIDYELLGYTQQEPSISVNGTAPVTSGFFSAASATGRQSSIGFTPTIVACGTMPRMRLLISR